jgi:hypothetical protein
MFEFHGWVVITVDDPDDADLPIVEVACHLVGSHGPP